MIERTPNRIGMATGLAAIFVVTCAANALAIAVHPAESCGLPCDPDSRIIEMVIASLKSLIPFI